MVHPSLACRLLGAFLGTSLAAAARPANADEALLPGARVERALGGGETHAFALTAESGQYLEIVAQQRGIDVLLRLHSPEGRLLISVDSPNDRQGPEPLSWVTDEAGAYRLEVAAPDRRAAAGRYELELRALRHASADDRRRAQAEARTGEAARLFLERKPGSTASGLESARSALSLWQGLREPAGEARALHLLGLLHRQGSELAQAAEHLGRSLALREGLGDGVGRAETLNQLGLVRWAQGDNAAALEAFTGAGRLWAQAGDVDGEARALLNTALVQQSTGRLSEAAEVSSRAVALMESVGHPGLATALNNVGGLHDLLGDPRRALEHYDRALAIHRALGRKPGQADTLNNVAVAHLHLGQAQQALKHLGQALALARETGDRRLEAVILDNLGSVHLRLGAVDQARADFEQALVLLRAVGDRRKLATTLAHLGSAQLDSGDPEGALERLREAARTWESVGDERGRALVLTAIAQAHLSRGQADAALAELEKALAVYRQAADRAGEAGVLEKMGSARRARGETAAALELHASALRLWREMQDRIHEAGTRQSLALAAAELGRLDEARQQVEAVLAIVESIRADVLRPDLRTSLVAANRGAHELHVEVLMRLHAREPGAGHDARALQASERFRARTLLDVLREAGAEIRQGLDPALADGLRAVQERIHALAEQEMRPDPRGSAAERVRLLDALLRERQQLEARVREASPRYAALTQPPPLGLAEIQRELGGDTLLLEYLLGERRSFLWAVGPGSLHSFELPPRARLAAAVARVRERWSASGAPAGDAEALALSGTLLGPAAGLLEGKRLVVVADGALQYLPFAALPLPPTKGRRGAGSAAPLVARHEVVLLPSASALAALRRELAGRAPAPNVLAVLADPVFDRGDPRVEGGAGGAAATGGVRQGAPAFGRLPSTRREARALLDLDPSGRSFAALDFEASRATATAPRLASYRYLHFATHGWLDTRRPELSGIVLSLVDARGEPADGFLRLHEVYDLRLGAELVALSACDTALGQDVQGEGLVGLARGFMYAGAPRVLASLWKVPDVATAELMRHFYAAVLREGLPPAAALRRAQLAVRARPRWRQPYFWAGFVLQGEWR